MRTFLRFSGKFLETGEFEPTIGWETERLANRLSPDPNYQLELLDDSGKALAEGEVELRVGACRQKRSMNRARIVGYVPLLPQGREIVFRHDKYVLFRTEFELERPSITEIEVKVKDTGCIHARWEAKHSRPLWFRVAIFDNHRRAIEVGHELREKELIFETALLPGGAGCTLAIMATDGIRSAVARSDPFDLPEKPPLVTIISPSEGEILNPDHPVSLLGHAHDLAGGAVPDERLIWSVNGNIIARGQRIVLAGPLEPGYHRIRLSLAQDNQLSAQTEITVVVSERSAEQEEWLNVSKTFASNEQKIG